MAADDDRRLYERAADWELLLDVDKLRRTKRRTGFGRARNLAVFKHAWSIFHAEAVMPMWCANSI